MYRIVYSDMHISKLTTWEHDLFAYLNQLFAYLNQALVSESFLVTLRARVTTCRHSSSLGGASRRGGQPTRYLTGRRGS